MQKLNKVSANTTGSEVELVDLSLGGQDVNHVIVSVRKLDITISGKKRSDGAWEQVAAWTGVTGKKRDAYDVSSYSKLDISAAQARKVSVLVKSNTAGTVGSSDAPKVGEVQSLSNRITALQNTHLVHKPVVVVGAGGLAAGGTMALTLDPEGSLVYKNGALLAMDADYTVQADTITFPAGLAQNDEILAVNWQVV
jgi:hypothetical protein